MKVPPQNNIKLQHSTRKPTELYDITCLKFYDIIMFSTPYQRCINAFSLTHNGDVLLYLNLF